MVVAGAIVVAAGLPERAAFTGRLADGTLVGPDVGLAAPPFEAVTPDGATVALASLRGQPVLINFWATWCVPCEIEMGDLQTLYEARRDEGLRIVAVNLREPADAVRAWAADLGLTYDLVLDPTGEIAQAYALRGQPSTYVISPDGTITRVFYGAADASALETALAPYLR